MKYKLQTTNAGVLQVLLAKLKFEMRTKLWQLSVSANAELPIRRNYSSMMHTITVQNQAKI